MKWCCRAVELCQSQENLGSLKNFKVFSYKDLVLATDSFHPKNRIGRGGFGTVFKGILKNKTVVAAKVLSAESKQGVKQFLAEIDTIANIKHPNLVELIGCCIEGSNRILVYEFVENKSLDRALLGCNKSQGASLSWGMRSSICMGTAMGLNFLHEEIETPIVHRDIKASNILLDRNFVPKIGDFGLAKLFPDNVTHISTRVAGTTGYLAPEYALHGQLTRKADVYSFGVLIIEVVSGRSISKARWSAVEKFLLEWAWQLYQEGRLLDLVDPGLEEYSEEEATRYIKVALFCTQAVAGRRPSMPQVVEMLSRPVRLNEKELTPPGFTPEPGETSGGASSKLRSKGSSSRDSTVTLDSTPVTCSELLPR